MVDFLSKINEETVLPHSIRESVAFKTWSKENQRRETAISTLMAPAKQQIATEMDKFRDQLRRIHKQHSVDYDTVLAAAGFYMWTSPATELLSQSVKAKSTAAVQRNSWNQFIAEERPAYANMSDADWAKVLEECPEDKDLKVTDIDVYPSRKKAIMRLLARKYAAITPDRVEELARNRDAYNEEQERGIFLSSTSLSLNPDFCLIDTVRYQTVRSKMKNMFKAEMQNWVCHRSIFARCSLFSYLRMYRKNCSRGMVLNS